MFNIFRPRNSSLTHPSTDTSPAPGIVYSTAMGQFDIRSHYSRLLSEDTTKSMPIAAMESLSALCDASKATTIHELLSSIEIGSKALIASVPNSISLTAGCAMFTKFISAHTHDDPRDFGAFKKKLQENGHLFAQSAREARFKIAGLGVGMLRDGEVVMVHGYSRCAVGILKLAAERNVRFKVIVTETRPSCQGTKLAVELRALGVPVAVIDDNAVAYAMKKCRSVLIGAESIFADASIINVVSCSSHSCSCLEVNFETFIRALSVPRILVSQSHTCSYPNPKHAHVLVFYSDIHSFPIAHILPIAHARSQLHIYSFPVTHIPVPNHTYTRSQLHILIPNRTRTHSQLRIIVPNHTHTRSQLHIPQIFTYPHPNPLYSHLYITSTNLPSPSRWARTKSHSPPKSTTARST
jgi:translation initiation factor eIF-2B subunit alpha